MADIAEVALYVHKKKKRKREATNDAPEDNDAVEPLCYDDEIPEIPKKKKHKKQHTESESVEKLLSLSPFPDGNAFAEKEHKKKHSHYSVDEEANPSDENSKGLDHLQEAGVKKKKRKRNKYGDDDGGHGNAVPAFNYTPLAEENGVECNSSDILQQEQPPPCKKKKKLKEKQGKLVEEGNMDENVMPAEIDVHVPKKKRKKKHKEEALSEERGKNASNELFNQAAEISNEESGVLRGKNNLSEDADASTVLKQKTKNKDVICAENANDQSVPDSLLSDSGLITEESVNVSKKKKKHKKFKDLENAVTVECTPPAESVNFNDGGGDDALGLQDDNVLYKRKKPGKKNNRMHFSGVEAGHNSKEMFPNDVLDTLSGLNGNNEDLSYVEMGGHNDGVVEEDHDLMQAEDNNAQGQLQKKKKHKKKHDRQSGKPQQSDEPEQHELPNSEGVISDYLNSESAAVHHELKDDTKFKKKGKKRHKSNKEPVKNTDCTGIDGNTDKPRLGSTEKEDSVPGSQFGHGDISTQSHPQAKKKKKKSTSSGTRDSEGFSLHKHKSKKKRKKELVAPNEKASSKDKKKKKRHKEGKGSLEDAHSQSHTKKHRKKCKREHSKSTNSHKDTKRKKGSENQPEHVEHTSSSSFIDDIVHASEGIEDPSTTAFISKVLGPLNSDTVVNNLDTLEEPPDFDVPPLHASGSVKPLPKKERESLLAQGVVIRSGHWTKAEISILMKNWEDFAEKFKVEDPSIFLGLKQSNSDMVKIRKFNAAKHFYVHLARDLNDRTLYSVYRQARQLLHPHRNSGRFSESDLTALEMLRGLHGNKWSKISELMDRPAESCRGTFRVHKAGRNTGAWSSEERDRLKKAVERFSKERNLQNSPNSSKNIPWEEVAKLVETRTSSQCRDHWYRCKSLHGDEKQLADWSEINEACLIYLMYHNMVEDEVLVDWRALYPAFQKFFVSYRGLAKKWFFVKSKVRDYKSKTHEEIVTHLYTKHLPHLIGKLGTSMSHLESLANQSEPAAGE